MDSFVPGAPEAWIAVMGVTGAGKSTFIQTATGDPTIEIGHGLKSCTSELRGYRLHHAGYNITLVDSPGFNDTYRSETEILQDIATWLRESYENHGQKLSGIVYLHSIENVHMEGSALRNLKMFRELCGSNPLKNVVLVTSFWRNVERSVGNRREQELRTTPEFWGQMVDRGSRIERFTDRESALRIIGSLAGKVPAALNIQHELVNEHKALVDTSAGQLVNEELSRLEARHKKELESLQRELREALAAQDFELQEILRDSQSRMDERLERINRQQAQLHADRRADRRRLESELEAMSADSGKTAQDGRAADLPSKDAKKQPNVLRKPRPPPKEDPDVNWIISIARANESKISPEERTVVEMKIQEAQKQSKSKVNGKKIGKWLLGALRVALPITTMILLGLPIHLPWEDSSGSKTEQEQSGNADSATG